MHDKIWAQLVNFFELCKDRITGTYRTSQKLTHHFCKPPETCEKLLKLGIVDEKMRHYSTFAIFPTFN